MTDTGPQTRGWRPLFYITVLIFFFFWCWFIFFSSLVIGGGKNSCIVMSVAPKYIIIFRIVIGIVAPHSCQYTPLVRTVCIFLLVFKRPSAARFGGVLTEAITATPLSPFEEEQREDGGKRNLASLHSSPLRQTSPR